MARKGYIYSDVNSKLTSNKKGEFEVEYDTDSVIQSVKNILSTVSGERVRNPIGSVLLRYLFEPMTEDTVDSIKNEILGNIRKYEPRIRTIKVDVIGDKQKHVYEVTMTITIDRFNRPIKFQTNLRSME